MQRSNEATLDKVVPLMAWRGSCGSRVLVPSHIQFPQIFSRIISGWRLEHRNDTQFAVLISKHLKGRSRECVRSSVTRFCLGSFSPLTSRSYSGPMCTWEDFLVSKTAAHFWVKAESVDIKNTATVMVPKSFQWSIFMLQMNRWVESKALPITNLIRIVPLLLCHRFP